MTEQVLVRLQDVAELVALAVDGLVSMHDDRRRLFCKRVARSEPGLRRFGVSFEGSIIATLGLNELARRGIWTSFSVENLAHDLIGRRRQVRSTAELGLLLWMAARIVPDELRTLYDTFDLRLAFERFSDGRESQTRALAWLLAGLSEIRLLGVQSPDELEDVARLTRQLLFVNYSGRGIFSKNGRRGLAGRRRGCFPDQAFSLYAFSRYARAFHDESSLHVALACADRLAREQGSAGQWWWQYDAANGSVTTRYPVLSLHQDALGPMALIEIGQTAGVDFGDAIRASLGWVRFGNERKVDMVDVERRIVWEGLKVSRYQSYARPLAGAMRRAKQQDASSQPEVIYECRPDHLGWLLFALSGAISA